MLEAFLIFSLTLFCAYLVLVPLRASEGMAPGGSGSGGAGEPAATASHHELEAVLAELSDLEYDYRMDKVAESTYRRRRKTLMAHAHQLLEQQDDAALQRAAHERVLRELGLDGELNNS